MKSTELMIGNWVQTDQDTQIIVIGLNNYKLHNIQTNGGTFNEKGLYGIPLTEEWLLKNTNFKYLRPRIGTKGRYGANGVSLILSYGNIFYRKINLPVIYVHQLQNLYYALTGEDLHLNK